MTESDSKTLRAIDHLEVASLQPLRGPGVMLRSGLECFSVGSPVMGFGRRVAQRTDQTWVEVRSKSTISWSSDGAHFIVDGVPLLRQRHPE